MKKLRVLLLVCLLLSTASMAQAEGFAVYEWGARSTALGGTLTARTPDPSAVASNPAATTMLPGQQLQIGFSLVMPKGNASFHDEDNGMTGEYKIRDEYWGMPSFYYTHQLNDTFTLGVGEYTRFGLGLDYPKQWDGRYNIHNVELKTFSLTPTLGIKLTDDLSIGLGFEAMYLDIMIKKAVDLSKLVGAPAPSRVTDMQSILEGDSVGFGGNFSLHYTFNEQWSAGFIYRTAVKHKVEGEAKFEMPTALGGRTWTEDAHANVTLPESATAGLAWAPREDLSIEIGATWTRWSRFRYLNVHIDNSEDSLSDRHWKDAWRFNIGAEYFPVDWLALRAGFIWDQCPVVKAHEDYLIPTAHRQIYSLGMGFYLDNWVIDLGYGLLNVNERKYASRPEDGVYKAQTHRSLSHIASVSVTYKF